MIMVCANSKALLRTGVALFPWRVGICPVKHVSEFNGNVGCGEVNSSAGVGTPRACPRWGLDEFSRVTWGVLGA